MHSRLLLKKFMVTTKINENSEESIISECSSMVECFLLSTTEGNSKAREKAIQSVAEALRKRKSIDCEALRTRLASASMTVRNGYYFVTNLLMPDIIAGRYDGKPETKSLLSSKILFEKLKKMNVEDDSEDGYGYERIDYYLNAVWMNSEITIDEIHQFTASMVVWVEARAEWRKASKIMELCRRSKILGKRMDSAKASEMVEASVRDCETLNDDLKRLTEKN